MPIKERKRESSLFFLHKIALKTMIENVISINYFETDVGYFPTMYTGNTVSYTKCFNYNTVLHCSTQ